MGYSIGDIFANVPNPGPTTGREQITYIAADLLTSDEQNFYNMGGLDELAANIQLVGLQQPIRVRPDGAGKYIIVSGHRRRAAIEILRADEPEQWPTIPCIIEHHPEESDAMRELRLIFANLDTRKMTDADLDRQAQRMTDLFKQLKAEGYKFRGRIRDYVAEALDVSKSKLSRLKVIRDGLISPLLSIWEHGGLAESCAVRIAQEDPDTQAALLAKAGGIIQQLDFAQIDGIIYDLTHKEIDFTVVDNSILKAKAEGAPCEFGTSEYLAQMAAEDKKYFDWLSYYADMLIRGLFESGKYKHERVEWLKKRFRQDGGSSSSYGYNGDNNGLTLTGPGNRSGISRTWSDVYDMLCSIALRDFAKQEQKPINQAMISGWMPGGTNPGHSCQCVVDFIFDDEKDGLSLRRIVDWNAIMGRWEFHNGAAIDATPVRWMELPEVDA